jgi:hypothetical protein
MDPIELGQSRARSIDLTISMCHMVRRAISFGIWVPSTSGVGKPPDLGDPAPRGVRVSRQR